MNSSSHTFGRKQQLIFLLLIAFGLNVNTLFLDYALDDIVVLTENKFVIKGIKGIPEIMTTDLMIGYSTKENLLSQPRYRPLSLVIFALEYQFFGAKPWLSHLINVLFFLLLVALLYQLLQAHVFREQNKNLAFVTCLLFVVHPIHTEVIANIKSRDELISFVLVLASLIFYIKYFYAKSWPFLLPALFCFLLALLTRESAVTFIGIVPLVLYFFFNISIKKSIQYSLPLLIVFAGYLAIRYSVIGFDKPAVTDVLNAPYLFATSSQAFATKVFILTKYLWLLVYPHPLSSDYSYNQIPYIELYSYQFLFSFLLMTGLTLYAIYTFKQRSLLSFCIIYFLLTISLVANFIVDIGTPLSERMLFQPSLSICILGAMLFLIGFQKLKVPSAIIFCTILVLFSLKTISRNREWKNNETLFTADVISAPNSVRTTLFASQVYRAMAKSEPDIRLKNEYLKKSASFGERSLEIHPNFAVTYLHLGFAYYDQGDFDKAAEHWIRGYQLDPTDPEAKKCTEVLSIVLYKKANGLYEQGNLDGAIKSYKKSVELNKENVEAWYNLGGIYFLNNDTVGAIEAWDRVKNLDPEHSFNKEEFLNSKI